VHPCGEPLQRATLGRQPPRRPEHEPARSILVEVLAGPSSHGGQTVIEVGEHSASVIARTLEVPEPGVEVGGHEQADEDQGDLQHQA
jgi:hypothetical protein